MNPDCRYGHVLGLPQSADTVTLSDIRPTSAVPQTLPAPSLRPWEIDSVPHLEASIFTFILHLSSFPPMPTTVPAMIVHGDDLDLVLGPSADLDKCYFDGDIAIKTGHRNASVMRNYLAHEDAEVRATPFYELEVSVIFKRETGYFATKHPGTGIPKASVAILGDRAGHAMPLDAPAGYFILGDIDSTLPVGSHRKARLAMRWRGFSVTAPISGAAA
ncbi:MAG: hypothetical protein KA004_17445 [Verrucomicrobiales bacterium]|nr:hypothetical protein [Verrucomicrobiales bacterium]